MKIYNIQNPPPPSLKILCMQGEGDTNKNAGIIGIKGLHICMCGVILDLLFS